MTEDCKLIGVTMGCPVGIGPEIILKFFAANPSNRHYQPVVLGDAGVLRHAAETIGLAATITAWEPGRPIRPGTIPVCNLSALDVAELHWGRPDKRTGKAMARYIEDGVRLIQAGILEGITTCPIIKKTLNLAGYNYPGHTEMLAQLCGADEYLMMLTGTRLRVSLVTIHEPISQVPQLLTRDRLMSTIRITARSLQVDFGLDHPRIAVAALNPHGGEQGMFGSEEEDIIEPTIRSCTGGYTVSGPWPPDTVFYRAAQGEFDAVIAMYHDQGLIPFKLLHFKDGVNVTLGLPIVRTSVDHGTAYDIAGTGKADCASLQAAFEMAVDIAINRRRFNK